MEYIPEDWKITVESLKSRGMNVAESKSTVKFEWLRGHITIEYGEEDTQIENRDVIISIIELL